ncbi:MAG TPA: signal peptidase II [Planctomycetota bacterium]|nr:signal peptidase II [Planctomycetota bacterium]
MRIRPFAALGAVSRRAFWLPAVLALAADLVSKHFAFAFLSQLPPDAHGRLRHPVLEPLLVLQLEKNTGGVFGLLRGKGYLFIVLTLVALGAVVWMLRKAEPGQRLLPVALGLVAAGAVGNLVDRVWFGYVRDFLYVEIINWPAFNIADTCICVAAGLLVLEIFRVEAKEKKGSSPEAITRSGPPRRPR